jgi:hypothetical protein
VVIHFAHNDPHCFVTIKRKVTQVGPLVQEVAVGEDRVGFAQALVDELHYDREVVLIFVLQHDTAQEGAVRRAGQASPTGRGMQEVGCA